MKFKIAIVRSDNILKAKVGDKRRTCRKPLVLSPKIFALYSFNKCNSNLK